MGRTTELREAVKRDFVPFLRQKGFTLDMSEAPRDCTASVKLNLMSYWNATCSGKNMAALVSY